MKLTEKEGKDLFAQYGIPVPRGVLLRSRKIPRTFSYPVVLKAQTLSGQRAHAGLVLTAQSPAESRDGYQGLIERLREQKAAPARILVEEYVDARAEYYVSLSYSTDTRMPVLTLSSRGGSHIRSPLVVPIDLSAPLSSFVFRQALRDARFPQKSVSAVTNILQKLWSLFLGEHAVLAEINPLFEIEDGVYKAGDAKIILDDEKHQPTKKRVEELGGDIAVIASGGGASMLSIDILERLGGRPANYAEYSGNPPREEVKELTKQILGRKKLKGCWVVGGTANFTDIYETIAGVIDGLRALNPRPQYPVVIRRGGPRSDEAAAMVAKVREEEHIPIFFYGNEISITESARLIIKRAYRSS